MRPHLFLKSKHHSETRIREETALWVVRRHAGDYTKGEQRAFEAWLAESPAHHARYDEAERLWQSLGGLEAAASSQLEDARAYGTITQRRRGNIRLGGLGLAALTLAAMVLAPIWWPLERSERVRTAIGERRTLRLGDGSAIDINTNSELSLHVSWFHRSARLIRGEALFTIAHSSVKPFEVEAEGGRIRDIGTKFDVRLQGERASVYVVKGEVSITPPDGSPAAPLEPGYRQSFGRAGIITPPEAFDAESAAAWAEGQLVLNEEPLGEVLAELGRYHTATVQLDSPELSAMTLSGIVPTYDLPAALDTIATALVLKLTQPTPGVYSLTVADLHHPKK